MSVVSETSTPANGTAGVAPSTEPSNDNAALIGGIVGGVVALLLVGGLIAFLVTRNRRNANQQVNNRAMTNTTATSTAVLINYDRFPTKINTYSDRSGIDASSGNHYDSANVSDNGNSNQQQHQHQHQHQQTKAIQYDRIDIDQHIYDDVTDALQ
jgi:predicted lipid-binding transport protein (Tim44 family)